MVAILGYSREQIVSAVQDMYTAVADHPNAHFHFPVGTSASALVGYPPERTAPLPRAIKDSFAGVGNPFHAEAVARRDTVLDIGAGAGVALLAMLGVGLALDEGIWAGTIALFAILTAFAIVPGARRHGGFGPSTLAGAGAGAIVYALFVDYRLWIELAGFAALAVAVLWDIRLRRLQQARMLGLAGVRGAGPQEPRPKTRAE